MSNDLRKQIYNSFDQKETDELVEIWETNDRVKWSETAFDAIQEILQKRLGELPPQGELILKHIEDDSDHEFDADESLAKFIDKDNAPVFYRPKEVLWMGTWLNRAAKAAIVITIIISLPELFRFHTIVNSFFLQNPDPAIGNLISWLITIVIMGLAIALQCFIVFFSLRALAAILKILMEMEFNSRGAK